MFEQALVTYRKHGTKGQLAICLEQVGMSASNAAQGQQQALSKRAVEALVETVKLLDDLNLGGHAEVESPINCAYLFFF